ELLRCSGVDLEVGEIRAEALVDAEKAIDSRQQASRIGHQIVIQQDQKLVAGKERIETLEVLRVIPLAYKFWLLLDLSLERHVFVVRETSARVPVARIEPVYRIAQASDQLRVGQVRAYSRRSRLRMEIRGGRLPYRLLGAGGTKVRSVRFDSFVVPSIEEVQLLLPRNENVGMSGEVPGYPCAAGSGCTDDKEVRQPRSVHRVSPERSSRGGDFGQAGHDLAASLRAE